MHWIMRNLRNMIVWYNFWKVDTDHLTIKEKQELANNLPNIHIQLADQSQQQLYLHLALAS